jgi:hypothetical protein
MYRSLLKRSAGWLDSPDFALCREWPSEIVGFRADGSDGSRSGTEAWSRVQSWGVCLASDGGGMRRQTVKELESGRCY